MKSARLRFILRSAIGAALIVTLPSAVTGQSTKSRQAIILARALSYELTLEERMGDAVAIAVVYRRDDVASEANAEDWFQALAQLSSFTIKDQPIFALKVAYDPSALHAAVEKGVDVLLVADGLRAETALIAQLARARRILTAGNAVEYVQTDLTLCVAEEGDKTKVFINLNNARLERIQFSSRLLALATLFR